MLQLWTRLLVNSLAETLNHNANQTAEKKIKATLRNNSHLDNEQRKAFARFLFGVSCLRLRLETMALNISDLEYEIMEREVQIVVLVSLYAMYEELRYFEAAVNPVDSWRDYAIIILGVEKLRLLDAQGEYDWDHLLSSSLSPSAILSKRYSYPDWLSQLIIDSSASIDEAMLIAESFNRPGKPVFRCNMFKCSTRSETVANLRAEYNIQCKETLLSPSGLRVSSDAKPEIRNNRFNKQGYFEVQDEGSQLIAIATGASCGMKVVDFCSGRGGKALHLADLMRGGKGCLICHDVDFKCLSQAETRFKRAVYDCKVHVEFVCSLGGEYLLGGRGGDVSQPIIVPNQPYIPTAIDFKSLQNCLSGDLADVVLVDAPCSSLGTLRRGPNVRWEINAESISIFPKLQCRVLKDASRLVKLGGVLVYATCTFNISECEDVVMWFNNQVVSETLEDAADFKFTPDPLVNAFGVELMERLLPRANDITRMTVSRIHLYPHIHDTDAFFISRWKRVK